MEVEPEKSVENAVLNDLLYSGTRNIQKKTKMLKTKQFQSNIALTTNLKKREKIKKNTFSQTPRRL